MLLISAKEGTNVDQVFNAIINRIKPPGKNIYLEAGRKSSVAEQLSTNRDVKLDTSKANKDEDVSLGDLQAYGDIPFKAFLFDAKFVPSRGVACLIKIMGG